MDTGDGKQDLILGVVDNYDFYEFEHFLVSLRQTGFPGHICLFAGPRIASSTIAQMRDFGVEVIPFVDAFPFVTQPHPGCPKTFPAPVHVINSRHFLYRDYLLKRPGRFRNVLLSDVRDVFFQRDPFAWDIGDCLHVAMENREIPIRGCHCTSEWILEGYGPPALERVGDGELSCAGTTLGPAARVEAYLELMLQEIASLKDPVKSFDQGSHNVLLHDGRLEPARRMRNFEGAMLTVGTEPAFRLNERDELVNADGSVIPIVHQFDRHPALARIVDRKVRPWAAQRLAAWGAFRARSRWRGVQRRLRRLHNLARP